MYYLELFLQAVFALLIIVVPAVLLFALVADAVGWYDSNGKYCGPLSKARRK